MQAQAILGLVILAVAVWTAFRIFHSIFKGLLLIGLAIIATSLVIGGTPELGSLPLVGSILPQYANFSSSEVVAAAKGIAWGIKIIAVERAGNGNMLVAVENTGQLDLSEYKVFVNGQQVPIINLPKAPLKKGEGAVLETNPFAGAEVKIRVESGYAKDELVQSAQ